jgi:hypothetical protein
LVAKYGERRLLSMVRKKYGVSNTFSRTAQPAARTAAEVAVGLGRIVALHCRSPSLHRNI